MESRGTSTTTTTAAAATSRAVRWLYAALGVACFALGAVGAVVPGLPTTIFLIVGSYFLARSCPALGRALLELRLFRPYAAYVEGNAPMPRRAVIVALTAIWVSIAASATWFATRPDAGYALPAGLALAGVVGTWAILRARNARKA